MGVGEGLACHAPGVPPRVLVVDDDDVIRQLIEINLELEGFEVYTAADGEEALSKVAELRPAVVTLDLMMPRIDGWEVASRLQSDPSAAGVKVVLLSARAQASDLRRGRSLGVDEYLTKPFEPDELVAVVRRLASDPRDEVVDVVDDDDRVVGQAARREVYARRLRHRVVAIMARRSTGEVFVHRRPAGKQVFPSRYDMFLGGAVGTGEDYETAARRELEEELGVGPPAIRHVLSFRHDGDQAPSWMAVYEVVWDGPVAPDPHEVVWGEFLPVAELDRLLATEDFCPDSLEAYRRLNGSRG
jgi:CheY-like chemotaxis protein/8-oxo-dGTP pyrophosphatase MutT (NUDIX family)